MSVLIAKNNIEIQRIARNSQYQLSRVQSLLFLINNDFSNVALDENHIDGDMLRPNGDMFHKMRIHGEGMSYRNMIGTSDG